MIRLSNAISTAFFVALLLIHSPASAMTDRATGINFAKKVNDLDVFGVGVRKKGPIRVYSVGMYCSGALREKLSTISSATNKGKAALQALCNGAKENPTTFLLEMNMKVGAEKISSAIADSVAPRYSGSSNDLDSFKEMIFDGVSSSKSGAAIKGTKLQFDCSDKGINVAVDGKTQGNVPSEGLANALCDVYLDDKCVSPKLRDSCVETCCAP